jgi:flagellar protein FlaG
LSVLSSEFPESQSDNRKLATDYWLLFCYTAIFEVIMSNPPQPLIQLTNTPDYRENYANSVQVRVNVWDFFLIFGTLQQQDETRVEVRNFQGIYLSPQQAKALYTILQQNLVNYENTFGEVKLDPRMGPGTGPVH